MATTVVIVDDHPLFRSGLKHILATEPSIEVVGEAGDGFAAVTACQQCSPHLVLMDVTMPRCCGIEATRLIMDAFPNVKVIAVTMHDNRQTCLEMLAAGACGYVLKQAQTSELLEAIKAVLDGGRYVSPTLMKPHEMPAQHGKHPYESSRLSPREREVIHLIAAGRATKEIAADLDVSIKTIETHRRQIMVKLQRYSVAELTKYAIREGLSGL